MEIDEIIESLCKQAQAGALDAEERGELTLGFSYIKRIHNDCLRDTILSARLKELPDYEKRSGTGHIYVQHSVGDNVGTRSEVEKAFQLMGILQLDESSGHLILSKSGEDCFIRVSKDLGYLNEQGRVTPKGIQYLRAHDVSECYLK